MSSPHFEVTISKVAVQVLIIVAVPLCFVMPAIGIVEVFHLLKTNWSFVIIFGAVGLAFPAVYFLIKKSTRKGTLFVVPGGIRFLFNDNGFMYERLNNTSINWEVVEKAACNYDTRHHKPFLVLRFRGMSGSFIVMQEKEGNWGETNWPLWKAIQIPVKKHNEANPQHAISQKGFFDAAWFKVLLWAGTVILIAIPLYSMLIKGRFDLPWSRWVTLLILVVFGHRARLRKGRKGD